MSNELYEKGLAMRKAILGPDHVERAMSEADDFSMPLQEMLTTFCWGWLWNRPGLEPKQRILINLAVLAAVNRPEAKGYVKVALRNGCTKEEVRETLLQVAVYCGMPAGVDAFKAAKEAIAEMEGVK
jgi:4-carboxymuconolactone decarboxylase